MIRSIGFDAQRKAPAALAYLRKASSRDFALVLGGSALSAGFTLEGRGFLPRTGGLFSRTD